MSAPAAISSQGACSKIRGAFRLGQVTRQTLSERRGTAVHGGADFSTAVAAIAFVAVTMRRVIFLRRCSSRCRSASRWAGVQVGRTKKCC